MSSLGMIGRANGKNNNRYAPLSDEIAKPDEVSIGSTFGFHIMVSGNLIEIPTSIEQEGEVYTVVPTKRPNLPRWHQCNRMGDRTGRSRARRPPCV